MNADLSRLRNELQVQAADGDAPGSRNSDVRYEILTGNYERKFSIDPVSGVISVEEPLLDGDAMERRRRRRNGKQSGTDLGWNRMMKDGRFCIHLQNNFLFSRGRQLRRC